MAHKTRTSALAVKTLELYGSYSLASSKKNDFSMFCADSLMSIGPLFTVEWIIELQAAVHEWPLTQGL